MQKKEHIVLTEPSFQGGDTSNKPNNLIKYALYCMMINSMEKINGEVGKEQDRGRSVYEILQRVARE